MQCVNVIAHRSRIKKCDTKKSNWEHKLQKKKSISSDLYIFLAWKPKKLKVTFYRKFNGAQKKYDKSLP